MALATSVKKTSDSTLKTFAISAITQTAQLKDQIVSAQHATLASLSRRVQQDANRVKQEKFLTLVSVTHVRESPIELSRPGKEQ